MKNTFLILFLSFFLYSCSNNEVQNTDLSETNKIIKENVQKSEININENSINKDNTSNNTNIEDNHIIKDTERKKIKIDWERFLIAYVEDVKWVVLNITTNTELEIWDILYIWDIIETNSDSEVSMAMSDNSIFRLNNNSKFIFESIEWWKTNIDLKKWSLWWRVLKSVTSDEVINISNNWVTAAIIWTSLLFEAWKDTTEKPVISVIDSYNKDKNKEWVVVTNKENKKIIILAEQTLDLNKAHLSIKMENVFENDIITKNSKKDIIYMKQTLQESKLERWEILKLIWEINKTIPSKDELSTFLSNEELSEWKVNIKSNISELLIKDELLSSLKIELNKTNINTNNYKKAINTIVNKESTSKNIKEISKEYNDEIAKIWENLTATLNITIDIIKITEWDINNIISKNLENINNQIKQFNIEIWEQIRLSNIKIQNEIDSAVKQMEKQIEEETKKIDEQIKKETQNINKQIEKATKDINKQIQIDPLKDINLNLF